MSVKIFKNLFQTISTFISIAFIDVVLLVGYIYSLFQEQPNYGWIILIFIGALPLLFVIIGFYWIFQKVIIDENGVRVMFMNTLLHYYHYYEIEKYEFSNVMRNPSITIIMKDGKRLNIDRRKKAIDCLNFYKVNN